MASAESHSRNISRYQNESASSTRTTRCALSRKREGTQNLVSCADLAYFRIVDPKCSWLRKLLSSSPPTQALCANLVNLQTPRKLKGKLWKGKQPQCNATMDRKHKKERNCCSPKASQCLHFYRSLLYTSAYCAGSWRISKAKAERIALHL